MDENKKRIAEKLKRDGEIIKKVKAEFGHEYSTLGSDKSGCYENRKAHPCTY